MEQAKQQEKTAKPKPKKKKGSPVKKLLIGGLVTTILGVIIALVAYLMVILQGQTLLKDFTSQNKMDMSEASVVYDSTDKEVTTLKRVNREIVDFKDIPKLMTEAFIATEDRRFEQHSGIDFIAVGRALVKDVMHRSAVEGGSTITQQLAKNMFLTFDKTAFRKATEVSIALALENKFSKDEIMKMYLNQIYFGKGAYGVKAASKLYFGESDLSKLKLWQMATLAAIPKSPATYSPLNNPDKSKERRAVVLKLMYDQGYITEAEKNDAAAVDYTPPVQNDKKEFATFTDYVIKEAVEAYGIEEEKLLLGGYSIYTTMNTDAQRIMEQTYDNPKFFQGDASDGVKIQSSMAIVNHKDGGIVALIGGRDYQTKGLNRAISATRQPGSAFKPVVVYGPAIETGKWNPYSKLTDEEHSYNGYTPHNYNGTYAGQVDMFEAVGKSLNAPAVWLLNTIGLSNGMKFATKLGFTFDKKDNNLAIALGGITNGTSPLQMAQAYGAFANGGYMNKSHSINKLIDKNGVEVKRVTKLEKGQPVMSPKTSYYVTKLLEGVVTSGTGTSANLGNRPTAGKTGTTQLDIDLKGQEKKYNRDAWFAGYTPEWSAAVWQGFDNTDSKHYVTVGSGSTAAIFKEVLGKALAKAPVVPFTKPDGVPELGTAPKQVSDLNAEYIKDTRKIKLNWTPVDDRLTYQVFRKGSKDTDFAKILEIKKSTEIMDLNVIQGETYQYYVMTYDPDTTLTGAQSNIVEVKTGDNSPSPSTTPSPGVSGSPTPGPTGKDGKPLPGGTTLPGVSTLPGGNVPLPSMTIQPSNGASIPPSSPQPSANTGKPTPSPSATPAAASASGKPVDQTPAKQ